MVNLNLMYCHFKMTKSTSSGIKIPFPFSPNIRILFTHLLENGDEARIVGGAVRDFLAGKKNSDIVDIDLACKYLPQTTSALLEDRQIKVIASGIKYGTITAIINKEQFQITTLRRDTKNFGRDCEVEFVDNFFEDAKRRDFTINALSVDFAGQLYDYFGGFEDLKKHIVKFIGDANERIKEDYLRILRFFRFSCHYAKKLDQDGLSACIENKNYLQSLSAERIRAELFKMFECKNRDNLFSILKTMLDVGILELIIREPSKQRLDGLKNLFYLEKILDHRFTPLMILAVISGTQDLRLSLSNSEKKYLQSITQTKLIADFKISEKNLLKLLLEFDQKELLDIFTIQLVLNNNFKNLIDDFLQLSKIVHLIQIPNFPINGHDLIDLKIKSQNIGKVLKIAQTHWWENDYSINKNEILSFIKNNCAQFK